MNIKRFGYFALWCLNKSTRSLRNTYNWYAEAVTHMGGFIITIVFSLCGMLGSFAYTIITQPQQKEPDWLAIAVIFALIWGNYLFLLIRTAYHAFLDEQQELVDQLKD